MASEKYERTNRKQQRFALESTWMVMREPTKGGPSRKQRRANLAEVRREARQRVPIVEAFHQSAEADEPYELRDARRLRAHIESLNHVDEEAAQVPMPK